MKQILLIFFILFSISTFAQKIKLVDGSDDVLKGKSSINLEFTYDGVRVGKFPTERAYLDEKKADYNKKEPGKGEKFETAWFADRQGRYEPRFVESFTAAGFTNSKDAEYTLIFNTIFYEPGFNVGVMRKPAYIDAVAVLVATSDKSKVIAKWTIDNAPGRDVSGFDFDMGYRIQESYATAGKRLGRAIAKDIGK